MGAVGPTRGIDETHQRTRLSRIEEIVRDSSVPPILCPPVVGSHASTLPLFHFFSPPFFWFYFIFLSGSFLNSLWRDGPACHNYGLNIWILSLLWWPNLYPPIVCVFLSGLLLWCYSLQFLFCTSL